MGSIFNTLNIGYSGLSAAQTAVSTTSHNISNAESEGYTRQRVVTAAATPIFSAPGNIGNGTQITDISRIFDNFVYDRYTGISSDKEYSDFTKETFETLSTYFPEIDNVGIKSDLKEYYNMWQTFADNPDNDAIKLALAKQAETLSGSIVATQNKIMDLQSSINDQLYVNVKEVNLLAEELANINKSIDIAEAGGAYTANDLRDKRNYIELSLSKLIGAESNIEKIESNIGINSSSNEGYGSYTLSVNGFNIVDGGSYHPIHISDSNNSNGYYELSYERQDGVLIPINESISGGRIGAILDLRGDKMTSDSSGVPTNGALQKVIDQMDAFAATLIESTNNIYASGATDRMVSNTIGIGGTQSLIDSNINIKEGAFDIVIYDIDGNETARRTINIDQITVMTGVSGSNSIEGQIAAEGDDNADGNANNDIDDFIQFNWATYASGENAIEFVMDSASAAKGYKFAIEDKLQTTEFDSGSNFAGALGLSRFFDGNSAKNIDLNYELKANPTKIAAGRAPITGDSSLSLSMVQQQFEVYNFSVGTATYTSTVYGMFDVVATEVGVRANEAILNNQTITAQFNAIELEYSSISKVSIDEELTNLIKYQTAYGAASKIITTIDQMMQTLLGIKQ
ncbi:MAG: flagellar hook-associated protein FlgK [Sulfurimonas sp. RIFCSPHIGHO2_12_FULL_36_9]|uniref:flagellar hook-associated protein FlgK n=1 Tax=Sulfurimonas sp. RIFCSPLOWO2_12_36_12 TaxID=1802253 RepID=UPI0008B3668E|nr:flagellar hook-associated protein FlgK [Sulfurimonas sp. RIFCSPLOWO2_12_36_12]OHD98722.1 MAG: flagellar hook-associated protein FlgK [Sulfurimonas sp. RIFCSPHIGHO2_12_FULL_36_9]OHE02532.1 MAG: flagellar hook-associated protein FlgK [Sulfurimonas sp. RIFCSPLOWO2_12_36_12]